MKHKRRRNQGLTLIELMLALGISATALSMMFVSLMTLSVIGQLNESRAMATASVASVLEEVNNLSFAELLEYVPPELEVPGVAYAVEVAAVLPGDLYGDYPDYPDYPDYSREEGWGGTTGGISEETIPLPLDENFDGELPNPVEIRVVISWEEASGHVFQVTGSTMRGH